MTEFVIDDDIWSHAHFRPALARQRGVDALSAANVLKFFGEALDGYAIIKPRNALDDGRHLCEDSAGLEAIIRRAINLAAALSFGTGEVAKPEYGSKCRLAITTADTKHGGSHQALAGLVGPVDGSNKPLLPRAQLE